MGRTVYGLVPRDHRSACAQIVGRVIHFYPAGAIRPDGVNQYQAPLI